VFGTVLHDVFSRSECASVHAALEDLCSPLDSYGWASVGVYAFFDPAAVASELPGERLLYIGLARDLSERFAQHAGIISFPEAGCKRRQINEWFNQHDKLGIACFVQSVLAQVDTHRERDRHGRLAYDEETKGFASHESGGLESATRVEGQLIETYRLLHGRRPRWNRTGGSMRGKALAKTGTADGLLLLMDGTRDSLFRSRRTLRELSGDANAAAFEFGPLHLARMETVQEAWERRATDGDIYRKLLSFRTNDLYAASFLLDQIDYLFGTGYLDGAPGTSSA
jgi:hypothetical protein